MRAKDRNSNRRCSRDRLRPIRHACNPDSSGAKVAEPRETRHILFKAHKIRAEAACNERSWPNLQNTNQGHQPLQIPIEPAGLPNSNTAISRLSASPTPGNAAHHSNVAHGVRESCTKSVNVAVRLNKCERRKTDIHRKDDTSHRFSAAVLPVLIFANLGTRSPVQKFSSNPAPVTDCT